MAGFRSLQALLRNPNSRSFLTLSPSTSTQFQSQTPALSSIFSSFPQSSIFATSSTSLLFPFRLTSSHSRFLSPLFSRWVPFTGPLFLSSPPWQLSQSSTPLYLHRDFVLRKAEALNLNLIKKSGFPVKLGIPSISSVPVSLNVIDRKEVKSNVERSEGLVENFFNLPNTISMSRLVSGPVLGWMIMNEWYFPAFVGLAISGATDWLDGYVARKMGINSVVGSYLDPLADKVLIGCVAVSMVKMDLLQPWLVGLVVFRDVGLVSGAVFKRASDLDWQWKSWSEFINLDGTQRQKVEPLFLSKVNTVFQLALVAAALLQPEFGTLDTEIYIKYLSWLVASTTVGSTVAYGAQHLRKGAGGSFMRSKSC